ncbi:hypothetical protein KIPB_006483 [Kipferlia bialata]|uniref:Uncharacterized protein n=1 Tax=Kipferlia bialata TaxID=797122 RepID=A0A9K3GJS6_9EUKA|nr:hypothetical protein KIPB_006483 [Kipferlia bialata]|eukprot:g6483.t1
MKSGANTPDAAGDAPVTRVRHRRAVPVVSRVDSRRVGGSKAAISSRAQHRVDVCSGNDSLRMPKPTGIKTRGDKAKRPGIDRRRALAGPRQVAAVTAPPSSATSLTGPSLPKRVSSQGGGLEVPPATGGVSVSSLKPNAVRPASRPRAGSALRGTGLRTQAVQSRLHTQPSSNRGRQTPVRSTKYVPRARSRASSARRSRPRPGSASGEDDAPSSMRQRPASAMRGGDRERKRERARPMSSRPRVQRERPGSAVEQRPGERDREKGRVTAPQPKHVCAPYVSAPSAGSTGGVSELSGRPGLTSVAPSVRSMERGVELGRTMARVSGVGGTSTHEDVVPVSGAVVGTDQGGPRAIVRDRYWEQILDHQSVPIVPDAHNTCMVLPSPKSSSSPPATGSHTVSVSVSSVHSQCASAPPPLVSMRVTTQGQTPLQNVTVVHSPSGAPDAPCPQCADTDAGMSQSAGDQIDRDPYDDTVLLSVKDTLRIHPTDVTRGALMLSADSADSLRQSSSAPILPHSADSMSHSMSHTPSHVTRDGASTDADADADTGLGGVVEVPATSPSMDCVSALPSCPRTAVAVPAVDSPALGCDRGGIDHDPVADRIAGEGSHARQVSPSMCQSPTTVSDVPSPSASVPDSDVGAVVTHDAAVQGRGLPGASSQASRRVSHAAPLTPHPSDLPAVSSCGPDSALPLEDQYPSPSPSHVPLGRDAGTGSLGPDVESHRTLTDCPALPVVDVSEGEREREGTGTQKEREGRVGEGEDMCLDSRTLPEIQESNTALQLRTLQAAYLRSLVAQDRHQTQTSGQCALTEGVAYLARAEAEDSAHAAVDTRAQTSLAIQLSDPILRARQAIDTARPCLSELSKALCISQGLTLRGVHVSHESVPPLSQVAQGVGALTEQLQRWMGESASDPGNTRGGRRQLLPAAEYMPQIAAAIERIQRIQNQHASIPRGVTQKGSLAMARPQSETMSAPVPAPLETDRCPGPPSGHRISCCETPLHDSVQCVSDDSVQCVSDTGATPVPVTPLSISGAPPSAQSVSPTHMAHGHLCMSDPVSAASSTEACTSSCLSALSPVAQYPHLPTQPQSPKGLTAPDTDTDHVGLTPTCGTGPVSSVMMMRHSVEGSPASMVSIGLPHVMSPTTATPTGVDTRTGSESYHAIGDGYASPNTFANIFGFND